MVRPTWVTAVGVLGIIFGCTGILGGGQQIMMPKILVFQQDMMADMQADMQRARNNSNCHSDAASNAAGIGHDNSANGSAGASGPSEPAGKPCRSASTQIPDFPEFLKDMWNFPAWFPTFMVISGVIRCLVAALYLFSAIWFIQLKPSSVWLFSVALSLSIALGIAQFVATLFAGTFMLAVMMAGSSVGMVIDAVLLLVIWLSDRTAFKARPSTLEASTASS